MMSSLNFKYCPLSMHNKQRKHHILCIGQKHFVNIPLNTFMATSHTQMQPKVKTVQWIKKLKSTLAWQ